MAIVKSLCVYCGSARGASPRYIAAAKELGQAMAEREIRLVYGGARIGMMGELADSVMQNGGEVVGVIPEHLQTSEVGHSGITELKVVDSMHTRKKLMFDLSDAFAVLPGGFGTLDELFEALTLIQTGTIRHFPAVLIGGEWNGLIDWIEDTMVEGGLVSPADLDMVSIVSSSDEAIPIIRASYERFREEKRNADPGTGS